MKDMLRLKGVRKVFNRKTVNEKVALDGIDLTLEKGEFVTIIGSNGAGKSTLLNVIAGVYPVEEGAIELDGRDITSLPENLRASIIGRVFQDPLMGTAPSMTIEENLAMASARGRRRGLGRGVTPQKRELFAQYLRPLGLNLEDRLHTKVGLLSGGQRQALTLLMATLAKPKLLLLDEHTASLDPKTAKQIVALTREIVEKDGLTTMMVTHNMEQALAMGNRLIMLHEGKVILDLNGSAKRAMTVSGLIKEFERIRGEKFTDDRVVLAD